MTEMIMVIEDSQSDLELIEALLDEYGYQICTVDCVERALALIDEVSPDLILMDILMPTHQLSSRGECCAS